MCAAWARHQDASVHSYGRALNFVPAFARAPPHEVLGMMQCQSPVVLGAHAPTIVCVRVRWEFELNTVSRLMSALPGW